MLPASGTLQAAERHFGRRFDNADPARVLVVLELDGLERAFAALEATLDVVLTLFFAISFTPFPRKWRKRRAAQQNGETQYIACKRPTSRL